MNKPSIALVVAVSANGVIGRDGDMPWRLSADLKRFKTLTMGAPIIMGRKTFQSIGKALPGRLNIVVTRDGNWSHDGVVAVASIEQALTAAALKSSEGPVYVIGGGEIYRQSLHLADQLYVTHVLANLDGDTHFGPIDPDCWAVISEETIPADEKNSHETRFAVYERRR